MILHDETYGGFYQGEYLTIDVYARTYLARSLTGEEALLKLLHEPLKGDDGIRFILEAQAFSRLNHRNIVRLRGFGLSPAPFLLEEYIPGDSLRDKYPQGYKMPLPEVLWYFRRIAGSLAAAHDAGIVHCKLCPGSILIRESGDIALTDFYMATVKGSNICMDNSDYLATELCYFDARRAGGAISRRRDIYSLGAITYELLCGRPPLTTKQMLTLGGEQILPPIELTPDLPAAISHAIMKALDCDPERGYLSILDFVECLEAAYAETL